MTNKRTRLNPKFFQEILYVKRNSKYIDMFILLSNKVNIIKYFTFFLNNKLIFLFLNFRKIDFFQ